MLTLASLLLCVQELRTATDGIVFRDVDLVDRAQNLLLVLLGEHGVTHHSVVGLHQVAQLLYDVQVFFLVVVPYQSVEPLKRTVASYVVEEKFPHRHHCWARLYAHLRL